MTDSRETDLRHSLLEELHSEQGYVTLYIAFCHLDKLNLHSPHVTQRVRRFGQIRELQQLLLEVH